MDTKYRRNHGTAPDEKRVYYVTGIPGVGKTTLLSRLQMGTIHEEWLEPPPGLLEVPFTTLSAEQREEVDDWIAEQVVAKDRVIASSDRGVHIVDRAPLDALYFVQDSEINRKARDYRARLSKHASSLQLEPGTVIILTADPGEVRHRLSLERDEPGTESYLETLQTRCRHVYDAAGSIECDLTGTTPAEGVEKLSNILGQDIYREMDLEGRLDAIAAGDVQL